MQDDQITHSPEEETKSHKFSSNPRQLSTRSLEKPTKTIIKMVALTNSKNFSFSLFIRSGQAIYSSCRLDVSLSNTNTIAELTI